ncbi:protein kinase [Sorangium cellulosum]|uniref:Protein kinase n=1 Tax=Sorangium cellulosum TaxID=56 RepID=A0A4P2Q1J8_SORCE|nr:protein kinase [Sorangium cellulosum]AUX23080.1 protein kinase [Sorangium cellulosum]
MSARDGLLEVGALVDGRYQVLGHLGSGGHSVVYEARQIVTTQRVALKLLRPEALRRSRETGSQAARFEREMQVIAQLSHPNIVRLLDAGRLPEGELYLALEFVDGETLTAHCQRTKGVEPHEAKRLMLEVLDAIGFAHERGVVHRDLKPQNIMVAGSGRWTHAKVLDFGIAALIGEARAADYRALTPTGEFNGTPAYMAPEQLVQSTPTAAADIYAWGLTFLECLLGAPVMHEATVAEVIFRQLSPEPVPIPRALRGHPLGALLEKATAKSPAQRFRSAREAYELLEACDVSAVPWPLPGDAATVAVGYERGGAPAQRAIGTRPAQQLDPNQETQPVPSVVVPSQHPERRSPEQQQQHERLGAAPTLAMAGRVLAPAEQAARPLRGASVHPGAPESPMTPLVASFTPRPSVAPGTRQGTVTSRGERRQLTVLVSGIASAERIADTVDSEAFHELVQMYQAACAQVIGAQEGVFLRSPGEEAVAYFGHPVAREDDALRAVQAALDLVEHVSRLNARAIVPVPLSVQIGVHTGIVVVTDGDAVPSLAGPTLNAATQLKAHAEPGTVLVSRATQKLIEGYYHVAPLGEIGPKGARQPLEVFAVQGRTTARDRLDARMQQGLTPLVGRDNELDQIAARWERASSGAGQVVLLTGEAGIGKSRSVRAFRDRLAGTRHLWLEVRCSPQLQNSAFYPVIELLNALLVGDREHASTLSGSAASTQRGAPSTQRGAPSERAEDRLARLEQLLAEADAGPLAVPLLATLLSIPIEGRYAAPALTPQRQRQETIASLLQLFLGLADRQPLVLTAEDLHWADPSTLELLGRLTDEGRPSPLLLLLTARPTFAPPWPVRPHFTQIYLAPLGHEQMEALVQQLAGAYATSGASAAHGALPREVVRTLAERSDGVPLFAEELTRMILESAAARAAAGAPAGSPGAPTAWVGALEIPTTLQHLLMSRLDRLGPAKEVAQLGAVFGRSFGYEALELCASGAGEEPLLVASSPAALREALAQLVDAELLFQRGRPPRSTYTFKHALVQDAAYQSLLRSTRQMYHARIAAVLSERFPDTPPELLARHYTEAALLGPAVAAWQRAGEAALVSSAHAEAISHLRRGLELLKQLPETKERTRDEITLQTTLGVPLMITRGYAAPEVEAAYARAHALCREVGSSPQLFPALWGLWIFFHVRGDYALAEQHGEQLLALAESTGDAGIALGAHQALGATRFLRGRLREAREHFNRVLSIYDPARHLPLTFLFGHDAAAFSLSHLAWIAFHLGEPERARASIDEALALCEELNQPVSRGFVEHFAAVLCCLLGDFTGAEAHAHALSELSEEVGMPHWTALSQIDFGWAAAARAAQGAPGEEARARHAEGAERIRGGLTLLMSIGSRVSLTYWRSALIEAELGAGHVDEASALLADTRAFVEKSDERYFEPELCRLEGELALAHGAPTAAEARAQAEAAFRRGREIAEQQGAIGLLSGLAERRVARAAPADDAPEKAERSA